MTRDLRSKRGFTLIEVIIAVVLVALAASILIVMVSRSAMGVHRPRVLLSKAYSLQATMENIVAFSRQIDDVDTLAEEVGVEGSSPANEFGNYLVEHNRFVAYDSEGDEVPATTNRLLKISIQNDLGETLTRLFARDS
jgi:prepilin-type N-terminal cleavage/methylation domain-containing protein